MQSQAGGLSWLLATKVVVFGLLLSSISLGEENADEVPKKFEGFQVQRTWNINESFAALGLSFFNVRLGMGSKSWMTGEVLVYEDEAGSRFPITSHPKSLTKIVNDAGGVLQSDERRVDFAKLVASIVFGYGTQIVDLPTYNRLVEDELLTDEKIQAPWMAKVVFSDGALQFSAVDGKEQVWKVRVLFSKGEEVVGLEFTRISKGAG